MKTSGHAPIEFPDDREAFLEWAFAEGDRCVLVGGLAHAAGLLRPSPVSAPRVLGKLIELARRKRGWSRDQLAQGAEVDLAEIVSLERDLDFRPSPRTVLRLARTFGFPAARLMEVAGLTDSQSNLLQEAAVQFAAQAEPVSHLSTQEQNAFEQFARVLLDQKDDG